MPPCKCTLRRPEEPWSQWPWIAAYQQKEKKEGAGRRSLYPKCDKHGNPLHKFTDGSNTVPSELKPKYKSRKPKANLEDTEQIPLPTLLSKRGSGGLGATAPKRQRYGSNSTHPKAKYQPGGSQLPFCMQVRAGEEAKSQRQPQPGGSQALKLQSKDYVADQLATTLNILEDAGARRDGYLWKRVQKTYLSHHLQEKLKRVRASIEC